MKVLAFGTSGAAWRRLIGPALERLKERHKLPLEVWGVEREAPGEDPLISEWFSFNDPRDLQRIQEALEGGEFDLAIIATWNETHIPLLIWLLGRVPRILLEKPVADDLVQADLARGLIKATEEVS